MILATATVSWGATWHVAQDGSGDFTVIQAAIDAASPGDEIRIHAGRYEEVTEGWDVWGNNTVIAHVHLAITKDNLTIIGDGPEQTIIGFEELPDSFPNNYIGISVTTTHANTLTLRNLALENIRYGIYAASQSIEVTGCRFDHMQVEGIRTFTPEGALVDDCSFVNCAAVVSLYPTRNLVVSNSVIAMTAGAPLMTGVVCIDSENVSVESCTITGGGGAIDYQQGTTGEIRNVVAYGFNTYGIKLALGAYATVTDCHIEGGLKAVISEGAGILCTGSSFIGQTYRTLELNSDGDSVFNDCTIINGGGWSVYCFYNGSGDCHLDVTNNNWGTDSEAQIAEWIHDSDDDSQICCTADFIPFNGPVATEAHSWSEVKGLFRGERDD
ncbi:MAG: right-handed parallel beta-helix repeat-containing protein [Candidatus Krumholzibacteriia bacterium]